MTRPVPPWQPMKVVEERESLADGRAVLGLPGGLRWVAQHDPSGFDPLGHRFRRSAITDALAQTRARLTRHMSQETAHQATDPYCRVVGKFFCAQP
jgi:ligand-binding SRPBCC domain-containing protein